MPLITVLMAVYNGEKYLAEAIDSILQQTFDDFEFLIINDASTDKSVETIKSYQDHRIELVHNPHNLGLPKSLNRGIRMAKGKYIARMDADDVSLPYRLEEQYILMENHKETGVCGSWVIQMRPSGDHLVRYEEHHEDILANMLFNNCIAHPSAFIRKEIVLKNNQWYDESFASSQDYEYWSRLSAYCQLYNLQKPLVRYRKHHESISFNKNYRQNEFTNKVRLKNLRRLYIFPSSDEMEIHTKIAKKTPPQSNAELTFRKQWLKKIVMHNHLQKIYTPLALNNCIRKYWWNSVEPFEGCNCKTLLIIVGIPVEYWKNWGILAILKLVFRCLQGQFRTSFKVNE